MLVNCDDQLGREKIVPGVSTKINGMQQCESLYDALKSNGGGSTYSFPSCSLKD